MLAAAKWHRRQL